MAATTKQLCLRASRTPQWTRAFSSSAILPAQTQPTDPDTLPQLDLSSLPSLAHNELEAHREIRALARKAAWEMPLLAALRKPFSPPTTAQPLRWRYTSYMGEQHPASRKVVLEFSPRDLPDMNDKAQLKLAKLAGARWNPVTEVVKMSCESFETQAMNKRFLLDTVGKLVMEARDVSSDSFEDVPLDTRHVTNKRMLRKQKALARARLRRKDGGTGFPDAWRMTTERRAELAARRGEGAVEAPSEKALGAPEEDGELVMPHIEEPAAQASTTVSGLDAIERAYELRAKQEAEAPVMVEARAPLAKGKPAKPEIAGRGRRR